MALYFVGRVLGRAHQFSSQLASLSLETLSYKDSSIPGLCNTLLEFSLYHRSQARCCDVSLLGRYQAVHEDAGKQWTCFWWSVYHIELKGDKNKRAESRFKLTGSTILKEF